MNKFFLLALSSGFVLSQPQRPNADEYADRLLQSGFSQDNRILSSINDKSSPSAAAALAYMKAVNNDKLCGTPTQIYLQAILNGQSKEKANAEATRSYINAFNSGSRLVPGSACAAADQAWRSAYSAGRDPTYESAVAFMTNWPGFKEGNPCAVSGYDYVNAVIAGKTHLEANKAAMTGFAKAFKTLAKAGKPLKDTACRDATKAFMNAIPVSERLDPANAAAFTAFMEQIFAKDAPAFDPVCIASLEGYIESYNSGDDLLTANLKAAQAFFREFAKGNSRVGADSPCAAATLTYAQKVSAKPSAPNAAAMLAYISEAIRSGDRKLDPVCAAAADSYFDAYIANKDEAKANEAAAVAYLESLDKYPNFDKNGACARAAESYIAEFDF